MNRSPHAPWPESGVLANTLENQVRDALDHLGANRDWQFPVGAFVVFRILFSVWAACIVLQSPPPTPETVIASGSMVFAPVRAGAGQLLVEPWDRWDTHWYKLIAAQGYSPDNGTLAFFPLYPVLIRAVRGLTGDEGGTPSALALSNLALVAALILLYRLTCELYGPTTARATLFFLLSFPTAFFLFAGYTESLFLVWAIAALLLARHGHWGWAGFATALAGLTRMPGMGLLLPLGFAFGRDWRQGRVHWSEGATMLAAASPGIGFWFYQGLASRGDAPARGIAMWRTLETPGTNLGLMLRILGAGTEFGRANNVFDLLVCVLFTGMVLHGVFHWPGELSLYSAAVLLPALMSVQVIVAGLPLASFPRYALIVFPVFISMARAPLSPKGRLAVQAGSLVIELLLLSLFVQWVWIA